MAGAKQSGEMSDEQLHAVVHIWKSKFTEHYMFGPLLEVDMSKKCMPVCREAHFQSKESKVQKTEGLGHLWHVQMSFGVAGAMCTLSKVSETWGFCRVSKNDGRCEKFEEDLERCISRGRRSARDMFIRDVRRSGR